MTDGAISLQHSGIIKNLADRHGFNYTENTVLINTPAGLEFEFFHKQLTTGENLFLGRLFELVYDIGNAS